MCYPRRPYDALDVEPSGAGEGPWAHRLATRWVRISECFSPVFTGAVLPLSTMLLGMIHRDLEVSGILIHTVSSLLQAPSFAFTHGVFGLFTGFMAGVLFAVGGWLIDATAHSFKRSVSTYAPFAIAVSLGVLLYGIAAFGPPETLARFG